jgi:hypothetical protein
LPRIRGDVLGGVCGVEDGGSYIRSCEYGHTTHGVGKECRGPRGKALDEDRRAKHLGPLVVQFPEVGVECGFEPFRWNTCRP